MQDVFDDGRLFLNFAEQTAMLGGKPLTLSTLEFRMLNLFCQNLEQEKEWLIMMWELIKDLLLVSLGMDIGVVLMCIRCV